MGSKAQAQAQTEVTWAERMVYNALVRATRGRGGTIRTVADLECDATQTRDADRPANHAARGAAYARWQLERAT